MHQQFCIIGIVAKNCFVQIPSQIPGKKGISQIHNGQQNLSTDTKNPS